MLVIFLVFFFYFIVVCCFFFFFQAEDGIRDLTVTGVQTCALPISRSGPHRPRCPPRLTHRPQDRKSTRLNSSHSQISYAVFCLKKKKKTKKREANKRNNKKTKKKKDHKNRI